MKTCTTCHVEKPESEYYRDARLSDGLQCRCKQCMRAATADWVRRHPEQKAEIDKRRRARSPGRSTGYVRKWRAENPEKNKALNAPSEKRRAYDRQRYRTNPERKASVIRRFKELNKRRPEIKNAITAMRRSLQKNALAPWADKKKIKELYAEAQRKERETGIVHHVDHIVPLVSPIVCGLHWEGNLRVIPYIENIRKSNKLLEVI